MFQLIPKVAVSRWVGAEVAGAKIGSPDCVDNCTFALRRDLGVKNLGTKRIHTSVSKWKPRDHQDGLTGRCEIAKAESYLYAAPVDGVLSFMLHPMT
jgi:hypothetical protein